MAEATKYSFKLKEVAAALMKAQGIHEGFWNLHIEFAYAPLFAGPSPEKARQALGISVNSVELNKVDEGDEALPPGVVYDANKLNPDPRSIAALPAPKRRKIRARDATEE